MKPISFAQIRQQFHYGSHKLGGLAKRAGDTLERMSILQLLVACAAAALAITILPLALLLFILFLLLKLGISWVKKRSCRGPRLLTYDRARMEDGNDDIY